jgi:hypothetical protein
VGVRVMTGDIETVQHEDARLPTGYATYPGDCRGILLEGPKGPNYMGEYMWPVTAVIDHNANTTRVGFSLVPPREYKP